MSAPIIQWDLYLKVKSHHGACLTDEPQSLQGLDRRWTTSCHRDRKHHVECTQDGNAVRRITSSELAKAVERKWTGCSNGKHISMYCIYGARTHTYTFPWEVEAAGPSKTSRLKSQTSVWRGSIWVVARFVQGPVCASSWTLLAELAANPLMPPPSQKALTSFWKCTSCSFVMLFFNRMV